VRVLPGQMVSVTSAMLPHKNLNSGGFLMGFEVWLPSSTQSLIHKIWPRNTTAHRFLRTAYASHTHGDPGPGPLTFKPMQETHSDSEYRKRHEISSR